MNAFFAALPRHKHAHLPPPGASAAKDVQPGTAKTDTPAKPHRRSDLTSYLSPVTPSPISRSHSSTFDSVNSVSPCSQPPLTNDTSLDAILTPSSPQSPVRLERTAESKLSGANEESGRGLNDAMCDDDEEEAAAEGEVEKAEADVSGGKEEKDDSIMGDENDEAYRRPRHTTAALHGQRGVLTVQGSVIAPPPAHASPFTFASSSSPTGVPSTRQCSPPVLASSASPTSSSPTTAPAATASSPMSPFSPFATPPRHNRAASALVSPAFSLLSASPHSPSAHSPCSFASPSSIHAHYMRKLHSPSKPHPPTRQSLPALPLQQPSAASPDAPADEERSPTLKRHRRSHTEAASPLPSGRSHARSLSAALLASPLKRSSIGAAQAAVLASTAELGTVSPTLFQSLHIDTSSHYSDRFIPSRLSSSLDPTRRSPSPVKPAPAVVPAVEATEERAVHDSLMQTELLGRRSSASSSPHSPSPHSHLHHPASASPTSHAASQHTLRFRSPKKAAPALSSPYSSSPLSSTQPHLLSSLLSPSHSVRKISRQPWKVLDAPGLKDDFYLNLVDWSASNCVAVALGSTVYLWSGQTGTVTKLCEYGGSAGGSRGAAVNDSVCSVSWSKRGGHLAVGTKAGLVHVWDVARQACVRSFEGHTGRVGCVAWQPHGFASGSRDKSVLMRDMRCEESVVCVYRGHKQEVCGLKWSPDGRQLASGGNDNKLHIWQAQQHSASTAHSHHRPQHTFHEHLAAVKAIAWSPYQRHALASGGGTADRHIRFFNTANFTTTAAYDTGSQVCNLTYSRTSNELLSTHGYSLNQIIVWRLPSMQPVATLTGHQMRVLYLSLSPDGATAVTGAGDETVRFWNVFPSRKEREKEARGEGGTSGAGSGGGLGSGRDREGSGSGQVVSLLPTSGQMR